MLIIDFCAHKLLTVKILGELLTEPYVGSTSILGVQSIGCIGWAAAQGHWFS